MTILTVGKAPEKVIRYLREIVEDYGIKLIVGREIKEIF